MASFAAFLEVKGNRFPLLSYTLSIHQKTDSLGRPASPTLGGTIDCVLSAPGSDQPFLLQWMFSPTMQEDGKVVLMQESPRATLKTISFFNAYCTGLQTNFTPGAGGGGSLQMHIRISPQRVAVGAIIHDNNWPLVSHGSGERFAPPQQPKPKKGLVTPYEYPIGIPQPKQPAPTKTQPPLAPQATQLAQAASDSPQRTQTAHFAPPGAGVFGGPAWLARCRSDQ